MPRGRVERLKGVTKGESDASVAEQNGKGRTVACAGDEVAREEVALDADGVSRLDRAIVWFGGIHAEALCLWRGRSE